VGEVGGVARRAAEVANRLDAAGQDTLLDSQAVADLAADVRRRSVPRSARPGASLTAG
jgi:hypothetical protein